MGAEIDEAASEAARSDAPKDRDDAATAAEVRGALSALQWFLAAAGALMALGVLAVGRELLIPIAVAILIWFLIGALANAMAGPPERRRFPIVIAKVLAVGLIFGMMIGAGRIVAENAAALGGGLNFRNSALLAQLQAVAEDFGLADRFNAEWLREQLLLGELPGRVLDFARSLVGNTSLIFLYVLFLLLDEPFFDAKLRALISDDARRAYLSRTLSQIGRDARLYLWLMFLISFGVGLATYVFCSAFGVAGAGFWGFIAFVLNFIPTIGSILAVVIPCVYALLTLDDPLMLLGLITALAATQFVAGEIVLPRVMGDRLNLSSFVILFALVLWGVLWGPVGMFLAIPVTVILASVCARFENGRPIAILLSKDGRLPPV